MEPYLDPRAHFLDDVTYELSVLIDQRPLSEKKGYQIEPYGHSAFDQMLTMLNSLDCKYSFNILDLQLIIRPRPKGITAA